MTREEIGQFILAARKRQKLSQKELAKKAGISRYQQILEIEKAQFDYSFTMLNKVISGLGYNIQFYSLAFTDENKNGHSNGINGQVFDFSKVNSLKENKNIKSKTKSHVKNSK